MTREAYARVSSKGDRFEVVAGLELRDDDDWDFLRRAVRHEVEFALTYSLPGIQPPTLASTVERFLVTCWPDRAYFVEVASLTESEDWIQVYDPRGFVKERCDHPRIEVEEPDIDIWDPDERDR